MAGDQAWAMRLRALAIWTFALGWVATIVVASGGDSFREGLATVIALGASVSLAAAAIFGVGAYVGRSAQHHL